MSEQQTYDLAMTDVLPAWQPGDGVDGAQIAAALTAAGVSVTLVDPNARTGQVTINADADPAAALAGATIGPTPAETARAGAISDYKAAVTALRGATTTADVVTAVKGWERATTRVLTLLVQEIGASNG